MSSSILRASSVSPVRAKTRAVRIWESRLDARAIASEPDLALVICHPLILAQNVQGIEKGAATFCIARLFACLERMRPSLRVSTRGRENKPQSLDLFSQT